MKSIITEWNFDIVAIEWWDAFHGTDPLDISEIIGQPRLLVKSVGYLLYEDEEHIALGFSLYESWNTVKHWQMIPKKVIKNMKIIEKAQTKRKKQTKHDI